MSSVGCPTPGKISYQSRDEARRAGLSMGGRDRVNGHEHGQPSCYRCGCGYWHLTTMSKAALRRLKRRRRRAQP